MRSRSPWSWVRYPATALALFVILFPFYWLVVTSFKGPMDAAAYPPHLLPHPLTLVNYQRIFAVFHFERYFVNSTVVASATTVAVAVLGSLAAYALARLPVRGKVSILLALLVISLFPGVAVISPLYVLMRDISWLNSYQGLVVPYVAFNLPLAIWILQNYFRGIPRELEESARMDGAGLLRTLRSIILPLSVPGLFTAGIFTFVACWTEFLMALTFNSSNNWRTIPVAIALFGTRFSVSKGDVFAASALAVLPITILVLLFRRWVVSGLLSGAVKG